MKRIYYPETIFSLWPNVLSIKIEYKAVYTCAFGIYENKGSIEEKPTYTANFYIDCPNDDCTCGYFDLYPQVANAIAAKSDKVSGVLYCKGEEAKGHSNNCDTKLEYTIAVEYRKDYAQ